MDTSLEAHESWEKKPSSSLVLGLIAGAAALFSWLGCYAVVGVLQHNQVIDAFTPNHDPRLRWFFESFSLLLATFAVLALAIHLWARRHMHSMDALEQEEAQAQ